MNSATLSPSASRAFWVSASLHGAIVAAFLILSLWRGCVRPPKPREIVTYIDVAAAAPPPEPPSVLEPLREPPRPPEPRPTPPRPVPRDIPEPRPQPTPPPKPPPPRPRVEPSTQRVTRVQQPPAPARRPPLTADQIREQLARGLPASSASTSARDDFPGWYFAMVRQTLYDAWLQPSGLSAASGLTVHVLIRVERDGTISRRQLVKPSGNAAMDDSVMRAVESVRKLRPLPDQYRGPYRDITVEFELTGG